jgi:hypothetical protein
LGDDLTIYGPDNRPFETYVEIARQRQRSDQIAERESQRAERLAARLRELGIDPDECE